MTKDPLDVGHLPRENEEANAITTAYEAGKTARQKGQPINHCPQYSGELYTSFASGWRNEDEQLRAPKDEYLEGIMHRDPKAPWRCVICGNDLSKCTCDATVVVGAARSSPQDGQSKPEEKVVAGKRIRDLIIHVHYEYPPIGDRRWDWRASYDHHDGDSGIYGEGSTPYMAIKDLIDNCNPTEESEK